MSSLFQGSHLNLTLFGESHGAAVGMTLEGIPAGEPVDFSMLNAFMARRAPGQKVYGTTRKETDLPEFLSGFNREHTCGTPITAVIRNDDVRSEDYDAFAAVPRPGHADFTTRIKHGAFATLAGGGHASGRLTAPLCIAGGICLQLLARRGILIGARIAAIGDIVDDGELAASITEKPFPVMNDEKGQRMIDAILTAKEHGDSLGGIIECAAFGVPAGLGDPIFDGMENRIAHIVFGIPAVKGIEFGDGFAAAAMTGSAHNDAFCIRDGKVATATNHCGGILGGITTGMPLRFRVAIKPTPSIALSQQSVNFDTMTETSFIVHGRHDPCIVPRAVPAVEAAAAIAILDAWLAADCLDF